MYRLIYKEKAFKYCKKERNGSIIIKASFLTWVVSKELM